jgi:HD-GYP domain-containing protein (c-di-GMP phosphodiesterase class II)
LYSDTIIKPLFLKGFMSKTLVVCDNEFLNMLYIMNLEVYLATSVELVSSAEMAISEMRGKKKYDLIISLEICGKKEAFKQVHEYLKSYGVKTPIIMLGGSEDKEVDARTFFISSRYNVQAILKKSANLLGVTARQMAEMQMDEYYGVSLVSIFTLSKAPCNIYQKTEAGHTLVAKKDDVVAEIFKNLKVSRVEQVYVRSRDRLVLINGASIMLIEKMSKILSNSDGLTTEQKIENLSDGYEFAASSLFSSDEVKQEVQEIATASTKVMQDVTKDIPSLKGLLATMTSNKSGYIFTHSMITSYVAQHIVKSVSWGGEGQTEKINFVLFFHDIFLAPIYLKYPQLQFEKDLLNCDFLNDKEKETVLNHARLAAELVVTYKKCPMGADVLIKHHHGMKKGSGFANRYVEDLSPLTKILLVAEAFVECFIDANNKKEKLDVKKVIPKLIEEFNSSSYIKIIQTLSDLPI